MKRRQVGWNHLDSWFSGMLTGILLAMAVVGSVIDVKNITGRYSLVGLLITLGVLFAVWIITIILRAIYNAGYNKGR